MSWKLTGIISQKVVGSTTRKLLLLSMADKANDDGSGVYASFATLAAMCEASRPTVKRLIKAFMDEGLIRHVGLRACRNGSTNEYDLDVGAIEALPDVGAEAPAAKKPKVNRVHGEPGPEKTRSKVNPNPVHGEPATGFMVNPKPIPKPIQEPFPFVGEGKTKGSKPPISKPKYTPEFEAIWRAWPKNRRANSDKQTAFRRYLDGVKEFGAEPIARAAQRYLSLPATRKENYRYCVLVEVFMNGKLEAAVEAVTDADAEDTREVWDADLKAWVERAA